MTILGWRFLLASFCYMYDISGRCCIISLSLYIFFPLFKVNVGCVPKKVMFNTALHAEFIHNHKDYGFDVELKKFDWG